MRDYADKYYLSPAAEIHWQVRAAREAITKMGQGWCLHPRNQVKRLPMPEVEHSGSRVLTEWRNKRIVRAAK